MRMEKSSSKKRIILLNCGSFNPITHMHLRLFELARDALNSTGLFDVIGGVISPVNDAYKKEGLLPASHRLEMARLAIQSSDWLKLDDWEAKQDKYQRTRVVLDKAKERLSKGVPPYNQFHVNGWPAEIKLLCGGDLLESFAKEGIWLKDDMETIAGEYGMVVITRDGSNPEKFLNECEIFKERKNAVDIVTEWIKNEVSATKIRKALRNGNSVRYLIPDPVIGYIKEHNLYKS